MTKHTPESTQPQLPFDEIPYGYCHCGCGQMTTIAKGNNRPRGMIKGEPLRYLPNHKGRENVPKEGPNPSGLCMCGCGQPTSIAKRTSANKGRVKGQPLRYIANHNQRIYDNPELRHHPLYSKWSSMIQRCTNPNTRSYADYGERGIKVCDEWRYSYQAFHDHALQLPNCGKKGYTLDRIDNSLGYFPGNVRWATATQQSRNKRNVQMISYNGETKCLSDWARDTGIKKATLHARLTKGWSIERALTT